MAPPDWVHADPPYTDEDAAKYGTTLVNRNKVMQDVAMVIRPGGFLLWYDMILPMYSREQWALDGFIGHVRSTNHRFRMTTIFRRLK